MQNLQLLRNRVSISINDIFIFKFQDSKTKQNVRTKQNNNITNNGKQKYEYEQ